MRACSIVLIVHSETRGSGVMSTTSYPSATEKLGERSPEVVVVVVEEHDAAAAGSHARHEVVRREDLNPIECQRLHVPATDPIGAPAGAGRDPDMIEVVGEDLVGGELASERDLHVAQPLELALAVVDDANPRCEPGEASLAQDPASQLVGRLGEHHLVPAAPESTSPLRALPARRRR